MTIKSLNSDAEKSNYFTFELYTLSLPEDWKDRLETTGRPIAISPLHDRDLYRLEEHYRVIYISRNRVTTQTVRNKFKKIIGESAVGDVQIISSSVRDAYDYLTDGTVIASLKQKDIYNKEDILTINNFDVDRCELEFIRRREKTLKEQRNLEGKSPKNNIPDAVSDYSSSNNYVDGRPIFILTHDYFNK